LKTKDQVQTGGREAGMSLKTNKLFAKCRNITENTRFIREADIA
jgi:hypothetical protein